MSLINEMLKNLEKRNGQNPKHYSTNNPAGEEESSILLMIWIGAIVVLIILMLTIGVHYYEKYRTHHIQLNNPAPAISTTSENAAPPIATKTTPIIPPHSVTVHQIHIDDLPDQTALSLDLSKTTNFTTQADILHNTETLTINDAWLDPTQLCQQLGKAENCLSNDNIPLPVNTATIKSIHINQNDGKYLTLLFTLSDNGKMLDAQLKDNTLKIIFTNKKDNNTDSSLLKASAPLPLPSDIASTTNSPPPDDGSVILQPIAEMADKNFTKYDQIDAYILLKQFDKAEEVLHQLTPEEKNSKSGLMLAAKLQLALGDNAQALAILNKFPFGNKNPPPEFYALYAATLEFNGRHGEAVNIYKNLVKQAPNNSTWLLGFAIAAQNDHQYALAKNTYQSLLNLKDLNPEITDYATEQIEKINLENQS